MPTYVYSTECKCEGEFSPTFSEFELNLPIDARDTPYCPVCREKYKRKIRFEGSVWAPTAGGMR